MKERLEEIESMCRQIHDLNEIEEYSEANQIWDEFFDSVKFNWLIEQAERVQELENHLKLYDFWYRTAYEQNKRYREALEFYADEEVYKENLITKAEYDADGICISNDEYAPPIIYFDSGEKARQALESDK